MIPVTKIQRFCTMDGPGIRTTVFLKGCPLSCQWCHNPETQSLKPQFFYSPKLCIGCGACAVVCPHGVHCTEAEHQIDRALCKQCMKCTENCPTGALEACASLMTEEEICREVLKDTAFYHHGGGVTFSGGEPTVHMEELLSMLGTLKREGISTAIETSGYFDTKHLPALCQTTDLFLWDIKDTDDERHKKYTGVSNTRIIENLLKADELGAKTVLRCIMVRGINTDCKHLQKIKELFEKLHHCQGIELLPYHTYGDAKRIQSGEPSAAHPEWIPTAQEMEEAKQFLGI